MKDETFDVGNTTVVMSEFVVALMECPTGCTLVAGVSVGCNAENNMVDLMNVRNEFDFTPKTQDATRELSKSIDDLERSPLNEALESMDRYVRGEQASADSGAETRSRAGGGMGGVRRRTHAVRRGRWVTGTGCARCRHPECNEACPSWRKGCLSYMSAADGTRSARGTEDPRSS